MPAPSDGDDTGWLVTFSDLVLQLFAFVVVAAVCGGATRHASPAGDVTSAIAVPPRVARAEAPPDPSTASTAPSRARETRFEADVPPNAPSRAPAIAALEPATAWAGDAVPATVAEVAAVASDPADEAPRGAPTEPAAAPSAPAQKRVLALGRYLSAFVAATAASEATVTAGDDDVRLAFGGRLGFRPGSAELLPAGRTLLREVQRLASGVPDLSIEVAGYTDDVPIHTREFPSNLELSLARAARVAHEIQRDDPTLAVRTVTLGFGEQHAIAPNDGSENRARNRRVEVRLVPRDQSMP